MTKLWQKSSAQLHPHIEAYTVGEDPTLDLVLMPYDIEASKAHAIGLESIGILTHEESEKLTVSLDDLMQQYANGKIHISQQDEDCHTVIEQYLVKLLGDVGKKIHTGRSRNDQVLVAMRLYMRHELDGIHAAVRALAGEFIAKAKAHADVPLPGYSHGQQAMLSSVGHYCAAYAESLLDDADLCMAMHSHINKNPLGSAAGFGVSFPLDREKTTELLGFDSTQLNSLYCQNSRGKFESAFMEALVQVMMTLGKYASDTLLFTTQEYGYFSIDESLVTGSSIMPQKKNLDGLEILRGNVSVILSRQHMVQDIAKSLTSGYHRDLQLLKKAIIESCAIVKNSLHTASLYLDGMTPNQEVIELRITKDIFMADIANTLVKERGIPFRDAYLQAQQHMGAFDVDYAANIRSKISPGAPGNIGLELLEKRLHTVPSPS